MSTAGAFGMDDIAFEEAIERATEPADIWKIIVAFLAAHGLHRGGYRHLPPLGAPDAGVNRIQAHGHRKDLVERYVSEGIFRADPRMQHGKRALEPFYWDELPEFVPKTERDQIFLALAAEADIQQSLAVPVYGPHGRNGIFGVVLPSGVRRLPPETVRSLARVFQLAHQRFCTLLLAQLEPPPRLSRREEEVLAWVARGKSNPVIAEILGISSHTVDAHLRRVYLKLGVFDRITATVRGLGVGLIQADD